MKKCNMIFPIFNWLGNFKKLEPIILNSNHAGIWLGIGFLSHASLFAGLV